MSKHMYSIRTLMYKDNKPTNLYFNGWVDEADDAVEMAKELLGKYNEYVSMYNDQYGTNYKCSVIVFEHKGNNYDIYWLQNSIHWMKGSR